MAADTMWRTHRDILYAVDAATNFTAAETDPAREATRARAVRRLIELVSEHDSVRRRCLVAAFGLIAIGRKPDADDIAWLVRDRDIGFTRRPSFDV
jgi:hypothetical protein